MKQSLAAPLIHKSATVEEGAEIGGGTQIWHDAHVRVNAKIGERCILGKGAFVDFGVVIGNDCKLQNYVCVYHGVSLGRGVFVGPAVVFVNDIRPRATDPNFRPLRDGDWEVAVTVVEDGASIGANSTILPVRIGKWALVGAGALVTHDVPKYALVAGAPARVVGWVCPCGGRVESPTCDKCGDLPADHPFVQSESAPTDRG